MGSHTQCELAETWAQRAPKAKAATQRRGSQAMRHTVTTEHNRAKIVWIRLRLKLGFLSGSAQ
jgi:hypothetical protein